MSSFLSKNVYSNYCYYGDYNHNHCNFMLRLLKSRSGFSLIEFLLYGVLVTMLVGSLVLIGVNILQGRAQLNIAEEVKYSGEMAMERINYYIRKAEAVNSPAIGSSSTSLSLAVDGEAVVFEASGNNVLTIKRGTSSAVELTTENVEVSPLNFTNVSYEGTPGTIRTEVTVKYRNPEEKEEYDFESKFYTTENIRR